MASSCVMISGEAHEHKGLVGNIFEALPSELSAHVFSFLSPNELELCSSVCHLFLDLSHDNDLWKRVCTKKWGVDEYTEWGPHVDSFRHLFHFLMTAQDTLGIWRANSGSPKGGVLIVGLEKGRIEGKVLSVYANGEVDLYPIFHIVPASSSTPSMMKVTVRPSNPHELVEKDSTQPAWKEGKIVNTNGSKIMNLYNPNWSMQYLRVPHYSNIEHGAVPLQGLYKSRYGGHGWEVMGVYLRNDTLAALKIIGDPNVPAGEFSWDADVTELSGIDLSKRDANSPPLQYSGRGQISPVGFSSPRWVPGNLTISKPNSLTFMWTVLNSSNTYTRIDINSINIPPQYLYGE